MKLVGVILAEGPDDVDIDTDELEAAVADAVVETQYFDDRVHVKFVVASTMTIGKFNEIVTGIAV